MGRGQNGVWTGTRFHATEKPSFMFPMRFVNSTSVGVFLRFCIRRRFAPHVSSLKTMAIYTDGACSNNGSTKNTPRGGYAFVWNEDPSGNHSAALENKGPDGQVHPHTSNRAELRAVIEALKFRSWWGEGWERIVITTDSEYVGKGATEWLRSWAGRDWRTSGGKPVANQDLWRTLSDILGDYAQSGCEISFWTVPRQFNTLADVAAKAAAERADGRDEYSNIAGVLIS
ncbi:ribonuclease H-like domain-containing protein [Hypoxylon sp. FL0890]|nr:ribonuclease H-like domain-containing protein [Hypoxylon sp. FL0890]